MSQPTHALCACAVVARAPSVPTRPSLAPQDDLLNLFYDEFVHKLAGPIAGKLQPGTAPVNGDADAEQEARAACRFVAPLASPAPLLTARSAEESTTKD